tara:strand:+ start:277 stop:501 length:225 start_codon:yes stop_codon:yes gene_type:complete
MPATRQYVPLDNAPAAPCDQDCWWWQRCKDRRLACEPFERFVNDPYATWRKPPKKFVATRKTYDTIFRTRKKCS